MHRLIVTSATYRQSSHVTPELLARDPYNRLLARGPRFRVEAEIVRDIALAASGLLNPKIGGPSVYPPAPEFLFLPPASYGPKTWNEDDGRRPLSPRALHVPLPLGAVSVLQTFDAPNGDVSCVRRVRSNTPLQALDDAERAAVPRSPRGRWRCGRCKKAARPTPQRLAYAFRRCLSRKPTPRRKCELLDVARQADGSASRDGWLSPGISPGIDPEQAADTARRRRRRQTWPPGRRVCARAAEPGRNDYEGIGS